MQTKQNKTTNPKKTATPRHIILKIQKIKDKEKKSLKKSFKEKPTLPTEEQQ